MLQWNDLHPYNAVHVVHVPVSPNLDHLRDTIGRTLESHGLTSLTIDRDRGIFQYEGGPASVEIVPIAAGENPEAALIGEIRRQLNAPFVLGERINPFRFFVLAERGAFSLGVAYFHAVAGAESLVLLMQDIVNTCLGREERGLVRPVEIYPSTYGGWLRRHPGVMLRKLVSMPMLYSDLRRSARPIFRDAQDMSNGFDLFSLPADALHRLVAAGRSWDVTLNDLFLAVLLKAVAPLAADRARSPRRSRLSIGSIVNIRRDLGVDSRRTFGLFLGSFVVTHAVPDDISVKSLALDVHGRTRRIKESRRFMGTPIDLACARLMTSFLTPERRAKFHQKYYPLWGGVTNMNLNTVWPEPGGRTTPVDYLRAVSTGPVTPLVLSITTVREVINVGLSYRMTVFSPADIARVKGEFLNLIERLEDPS